MTKKIIILIIFILLLDWVNCFIARSEESYTNEEICQAIFFAEGGLKTRYPYGIKSVYCGNIEECKTICLRTIENNRTRYLQYGYKEFHSYLNFLASRYCPISVSGCENWLSNVNYFLNKFDK